MEIGSKLSKDEKKRWGLGLTIPSAVLLALMFYYYKKNDELTLLFGFVLVVMLGCGAKLLKESK